MDLMDQFFKKKLSERQYEYQEAYWEEAERLIKQREGRRRRAFWWWGFVAALLLIGIGVAVGEYGWSQHDNRPAYEAVEPIMPDGQKKNSGRSREWLPEELRVERTPSANGALDTPGLDAGKIDEPSRESTADSDKAPFPAQNGKEHSANPAGLPSIRFSRKGLLPPVEDAPDEAEIPVYEQFTPVAASKGTDSAEMVKSPEAVLLHMEQITIQEAKTLLGPIRWQEGEVHMVRLEEKSAIQPRRRLNWELALAASANPSDGKKLPGGIAGLRTSVRVREKMHLILGAQYRMRGGTFNSSGESEVSAYRFGREVQRYSLQPNRLHYVEALAQVEWAVRRHHIAAGLGWGYLLGVQGGLNRSVKEEFSLSFGAADTRERGWLDEEGFKKQFWLGRAGYHYQLPGRWKIGVEIQYTPGGILQETTGEEPGIPLLKESGPLLFDLGIIYRL